MKFEIKNKSKSARFSLLGAFLNLLTLIGYCIYGAVYDYFDTVVCLALILGVVSSLAYVALEKPIAEFLNLLAVVCVAYGMGLFFLNSYPVWADRLNNITMYGSRGTLVPVVTIIVACLLVEILDTISCFMRKGAGKP